ncbi:DeoR/GlpR family DNA-binding transcription regulator [Tanticharoenia sakaeratensis]|uniref:Transcriptional regulator n=1 Tax=Tanticharoenia sakaeratensis NBRC 103193 TaxID=1231623 RepID=A0A0D6MLN5_9PROT|nr:DeoR/GlpR family DNA-binding transcription regulator [Tanticharoenia sakaeratensis]GAN54315.1 transcriptional regulator [Tanticharoenia sakaeratensis NBRC 103193]GBQ24065.1 transcriptional regulator [Tanticharoenia sakaeratensis NBRC 103193]
MNEMLPSARHGMSERRRHILDHVIEHGGAQIDELVARFQTSRMTIHRDLHALAEQGLLRKVHGGVTTLSNGIVESSVLHRARRAASQKRAIAAVAASLITAGDVVALDDSTTARCLSERLMVFESLTVITNSLGIAATVSGRRDINLITLGGRYHPTFDASFGLLCEQAIASLRANTLFMSVSAIHGMTAYHQEQDVVKAKHAFMQIVDRRVLMADSGKFGSSALNRLAHLSEFDVVITDAGLPAETRRQLIDSGVTLRIAEPTATTHERPLEN